MIILIVLAFISYGFIFSLCRSAAIGDSKWKNR